MALALALVEVNLVVTERGSFNTSALEDKLDELLVSTGDEIGDVPSAIWSATVLALALSVEIIVSASEATEGSFAKAFKFSLSPLSSVMLGIFK